MTNRYDPQLEDQRKSLKHCRNSDESPHNVVLSPNYVSSPRAVLALQRTYGNKAVRRMIENQPPHVQRSFLSDTLAMVEHATNEIKGRNAVQDFDVTVSEPLTFTRNPQNPNEGKIEAKVDILAMFDPSDIDIEDLEYRQYIKGHVEMYDRGSGKVIPLDEEFRDLPDGKLHDDWQEDGDTTLGAGMAGYHYGHRDYKDHDAGARDQYLPDRKTGDMYVGWDFPRLEHIPAVPKDKGDTITWRMNFRGEIKYKGVTVTTKYWNVTGTIRIPDATVNKVVAT